MLNKQTELCRLFTKYAAARGILRLKLAAFDLNDYADGNPHYDTTEQPVNTPKASNPLYLTNPAFNNTPQQKQQMSSIMGSNHIFLRDRNGNRVTDPRVAQAWMQANPKKYQQFVAQRNQRKLDVMATRRGLAQVAAMGTPEQVRQRRAKQQQMSGQPMAARTRPAPTPQQRQMWEQRRQANAKREADYRRRQVAALQAKFGGPANTTKSSNYILNKDLLKHYYNLLYNN